MDPEKGTGLMGRLVQHLGKARCSKDPQSSALFISGTVASFFKLDETRGLLISLMLKKKKRIRALHLLHNLSHAPSLIVNLLKHQLLVSLIPFMFGFLLHLTYFLPWLIPFLPFIWVLHFLRRNLNHLSLPYLFTKCFNHNTQILMSHFCFHSA